MGMSYPFNKSADGDSGNENWLGQLQRSVQGPGLADP